MSPVGCVCRCAYRAGVGKEYLSGIAVIQITLLSIPFYLFFVALRSAIDAASVIAYNAHNGYVALAVFLSCPGLAVEFAPRGLLLHSIAAALMVANAVLARRTSSVAAKLLNLRIPWRECALPTLSAIMLGVAYLLHKGLGRTGRVARVGCGRIGDVGGISGIVPTVRICMAGLLLQAVHNPLTVEARVYTSVTHLWGASGRFVGERMKEKSLLFSSHWADLYCQRVHIG